MQSASSSAFPEPLLAAMPQLREKLRLGFERKNPALNLGHTVCNSTTALGVSWSVASGTRQSDMMGRFLSPDWSAKAEPVPYAKMDNPQSLNLYSYAGNNPLSRTDPDGHFWQELGNWFNYGHWVNNAGLENALANDAQKALATMNKEGVTVNGKSSGEIFSGLTNKQIVDGSRYVQAQLVFESLNIDCPKCSSDSSIAGTLYRPRNGATGKAAADDIPSWAKGEAPKLNENGKQFARRLLDEKYGQGNYRTGPGSEFNKIQKFGDRAFEPPAGRLGRSGSTEEIEIEIVE